MSWLPRKCVVVPFDFSDRSADALESACEFVDSPSRLHAIYVLPPILAAEPGVYWQFIDEEERRRHALEAFEKSAVASQLQGIDMHVEIGDPGRTIAEFAGSKGADLIVMPSHGRTGISRLFLGSVAERVVRLAHCPVLILK